ncbi:MAG: hypothetical protein GC182_20185 [Rhodopseudomonas sp.]|nr:hypothetical protein [Rhodopseudomonas sp.]
MALPLVCTASLQRLTPIVAAIYLAAFGLAPGNSFAIAQADPAPSRDTAVAPEPAPAAQRNAPPAKIAPPLNAATPKPSTDGFDSQTPTPDRLTPGHGGTVKPDVTPNDAPSPVPEHPQRQ